MTFMNELPEGHRSSVGTTKYRVLMSVLMNILTILIKSKYSLSAAM